MIPKTEIYFATRKTASAHVYITKGVGKMPESIRDVLVKQGYDIVSQPTYRYGVLDGPVGSEILLKEFPIK